MSFTLPELPYSFNALEQAIDAQTVEIHYTKHHTAYLNNLNATLEKYPQFFNHPIEHILADLNQVPEEIRTAVRNNGGGYYNHILYWNGFSPDGGGEPKGKLGQLIERTFGSFLSFSKEIEKAGMTRFGSGWAWLSRKSDGSLVIHSTPNQDTPLAEGLHPVIGVDVWEHAYYLRYQNRRADYLGAIWKIINWEEAEKRYLQ
ncbi:MAG: superoxide dismutase [Anaerolineaceae bacterium]|nr:superoxide dismutase [Anaerolineaceae bacterium]